MTLVVLPIVSKSFSLLKLIGFGTVDRVQTILMRTVGLSLDHGLIMLPLLIIVGWCTGIKVDYKVDASIVLFLFLQWRYLVSVITSMEAALTDWFKAVIILGLYSIFAVSVYLLSPYG